MRTKEQIQELLSTVVFTEVALQKILGFMIGKGLKEEDEKMKVIIPKEGEGENWAFFYSWYKGDFEISESNVTCSKCPLCEMLNECLDVIDNEKDPKKVQKASERYQFLMEAFNLDEH